jgi:2-keto-3-deoxy-L-rhamnonate aldolase RhmA
MRINRVKQALREGRVQIGCSTSQIRSPEIQRALAAAGLDWTYLDSEHGGFDLETLQDMIRAGNDAGLCTIVRVADLQYSLIARALDCGAQGVLFPRVESPELLARAISWTRFPPQGVRGFGLQPTHLAYERASMPEIIAHMNANTMVVLQIETRAALERIEELLSVPDIDAVMIGPADLSVSLGVPGEFDHPKMIQAIEQIRDACIRHGIAPGIHMRALNLVRNWRDKGLRFLSCNSEIGFLVEKASETVAALRERERRGRFRQAGTGTGSNSGNFTKFVPVPAFASCGGSLTESRPRSTHLK